MSISEPDKITTPWASTGSKNPIPANANNTTGAAGFDNGFPDITMTPEEAGGLPPAGQDFNGIFYQITDIIRYMQAGGQPFFNEDMSAAIGGYPKGCWLLGDDGITMFQNTINGNSSNPNSGGSGWVSIIRDIQSSKGMSVIGVCNNASDMRLLTGLPVGRKIQLLGYYANTPGIGGGVLAITDDTSSSDNGGTVFVTADGVRVKRERSLRLRASDFGARGDWNGATGTDNRTRIEAMITASNSSQPWEIDLDNVGVQTIQVNAKNNWIGRITGSVVNISAKPSAGATNEKDTAGGVLPTFKITNCNKWKIKGGDVDNRYREAFYVENCNKFVNECDVTGSGLNNNLIPNYYRYCGNFKLKSFRHEKTSEKPASGYYSWCNNINLWDCANFKIFDFEVDGTGSNGVYIGSNCRDYLISDYTITSNAMSGIQLAWSSFGTFPYRGVIGKGLINGNRADGLDVNNTDGSVARIELTVSGMVSVNNGYNDDGTVTADGSGLGTFKNVSQFDLIGCSTEDPARAGFFAYNCRKFNVIGGSIKKHNTTNNEGEGIYIESCENWLLNGLSAKTLDGQEVLKLYGINKNGTIGKNTSLVGKVVLPTPSAGVVEYHNVSFDGAIIDTQFEIIGYVPFKNTKINSASNGLRAYKNVDNCDIDATGGIGVIYSAPNVTVSGGRYKGSNSGTSCSGLAACGLAGAEAIGGTGPGSHWVNSSQPRITGNNIVAGSGNSLRTEADCTKIVSFGNTYVGFASLGGAFDINF